MFRAVLDTKRLAVSVGIPEGHWHQVLLEVDGSVVTQRERVVERRVIDWAPEVDDLETVLEELGRVGGREVSVHARDGCTGRLIDVRACDGLTSGGCLN